MSREFRIRACPECGTVDMPHYRDDRPYCKRPAREHESGRQPRLAWFEVRETGSIVNLLNDASREAADPGKGYFEFSRSGTDKVLAYQWASGEHELLEDHELEDRLDLLIEGVA